LQVTKVCVDQQTVPNVYYTFREERRTSSATTGI